MRSIRVSKRILPFSLGIACLGYGAYGLWVPYRATHNPAPLPDATRAVVQSTDQPDETPIAATQEYRVPADRPRAISLPAISARGFIQPVGTDQTGAIAVPANIHMAGWFIRSAKPGDAGVSIIDGHVQGRYQPAIFKRLVDLRPGNVIQIEYGDRSMRSFEVVSIKTLNTAEAAKQMLIQNEAITEQLNLITCGGRYNAKTDQYEKRILVTSRQIL